MERLATRFRKFNSGKNRRKNVQSFHIHEKVIGMLMQSVKSEIETVTT
jgi:hypothetical protein